MKDISNKGFIIIFILILLVLTGAYYFNYVYEKDDPADVIYKFAQGINEKDIMGVLSCLDPQDEKIIIATSNILKGFIKFNLTDVLDLFPLLIDIGRLNGLKADLKMEIKDIISKNTSGNDSIVHCNVKIISTDENGHTSSEEGVAKFIVKKFDGEWRIMDIQ